MRVFLALALAGCVPEEETPDVQPVELDITLANVSAPGALVPDSTGEPLDHLLAPGVLIVHEAGWQLFAEGEPARPELEILSEDGDNTALVDGLDGEAGVVSVRAFAPLDENYDNAPLLPGEAVTATVALEPGQRITVAAMYGESNDGFVATPPEGLALLDGEEAGDLSAALSWYDAGTELNEEIGAGDFQPARQPSPGEGPDEDGVVSAVAGTDGAGFAWPDVGDVVALEAALP